MLFDGNPPGVDKGSEVKKEFQYRFLSKGGGEIWTPILSFECPTPANAISMYPESEDYMIFAVL